MFFVIVLIASIFMWWLNLVGNLLLYGLNLVNFNFYLAEFDHFAIARMGICAENNLDTSYEVVILKSLCEYFRVNLP